MLPRLVPALFLISLAGVSAIAQQTGDSDFRFTPATPAFAPGAGPIVCIDEAHNNFHTAEGRYRPFADLLRADGFVVRRSVDKFSAPTLQQCGLLVIANAVGEANAAGDWSYPHPSAFSGEEIESLHGWISGGGSLLLFVDHSPMPGAAADLMAVLGAYPLDGYALSTTRPPNVDPNNTRRGVPDLFTVQDGLLKDHPITRGRNDAEAVSRVRTFTGHAFQASNDFDPLIVFGPTAAVLINLAPNLPDVPRGEYPRIPVAGWLHGAARTLGDGRVVLLGEAAMCTAQKAGPTGRPMGMNHPEAAQNPQFCLNAVRWLTRVLD